MAISDLSCSFVIDDAAAHVLLSLEAKSEPFISVDFVSKMATRESLLALTAKITGSMAPTAKSD